jgi:hypothetical protein
LQDVPMGYVQKIRRLVGPRPAAAARRPAVRSACVEGEHERQMGAGAFRSLQGLSDRLPPAPIEVAGAPPTLGAAEGGVDALQAGSPTAIASAPVSRHASALPTPGRHRCRTPNVRSVR